MSAVSAKSMEKLLKRVFENEPLYELLTILSGVCTFLVVPAFLYSVYASARTSVGELAGLLITLAIPFIAVTVARRVIDEPRPIQTYTFYSESRSSTRSASFPSRHVFSAFAIGVATLPYSTVLGIAALVSGVMLAVTRVLIGKHFPRDVIAGALIGASTSLIGMLIFR